jgi:hypothetical protein
MITSVVELFLSAVELLQSVTECYRVFQSVPECCQELLLSVEKLLKGVYEF